MTRLNAANNAQTRLEGDITDAATSFYVEDASVFPATPFLITIDSEIMKVEAKSGNLLSSISRGQEGTTAAAHTGESLVENRWTAGMYDSLVTQTEFSSHFAETVSQVTLVTEPYDQVTKTTVNLGFRPKMVNIKAAILNTKYQSDGNALNGSYQYSQYIFASDSNVSIAGPIISLAYNSSNYMSGSIAFTDTGIEITWTLTGTLTGASGNRRLIISAVTH